MAEIADEEFAEAEVASEDPCLGFVGPGLVSWGDESEHQSVEQQDDAFACNGADRESFRLPGRGEVSRHGH